MTKKGWIVFVFIVAAALVGAVYISRQSQVDTSNLDPSVVQLANDENGQIGDHTRGNVNAKVVLIEYGDFQCPGCASASPIVKQITDKYADKMLLIFRNRMMNYHQNARAAASFAEAAGYQGKYWEMHDLLYQTQDAWENLSGQARTDYFAGLITQLGGDAEKATSDIEKSEVSKKLNIDAALAEKQGVTSTPSLYLNGKLIDQYYKDGQIVDKNTDGAQLIWSNAEALDTLIIQPALREAGVL